MTEKELKLKLDRSRWWSLREQPFYGSLAMGLEDVLCDVKTACTDGKRIKWGKAFLEKLTDEETRFVLLHETMHCAHNHLWRLPMNEKANIACDFAINRILSSIPGLAMPKGGLLDARWDGLAEEEIYARLPDPPKGGKGPGKEGDNIGSPTGDFEAPADKDGQGQGKPDPTGQIASRNDGNDSKGNGEGDAPSLQEEWQRRVIQAQQVANAQRGTVPADMQRILERVLATPVDWRKEMADFVRSVISTRNDWSRSARRHAWQKVIYPRKRADDCGLVIFGTDVSGSITDEIGGHYLSQVDSCMAEAGCRGLMLPWDTIIHGEYWLEPGVPCPDSLKGGGGSDCNCVFDRAKELQEAGEHIAGIVMLSDLYASMPDSSEFATLWLSTTDQVAPFGRTVRIEK